MVNFKLGNVSLFTYHTHNNFDSADPRSMQDACHMGTQDNDLVLNEFLKLTG